MSIWGKDPALAATVEIGALITGLASMMPEIDLRLPQHDGRYSQREVAGILNHCNAAIRKGNANAKAVVPALERLKTLFEAMREIDQDQQERIIELENQVDAWREEAERLRAERGERRSAVSVSIPRR